MFTCVSIVNFKNSNFSLQDLILVRISRYHKIKFKKNNSWTFHDWSATQQSSRKKKNKKTFVPIVIIIAVFIKQLQMFFLFNVNRPNSLMNEISRT